jgi:hypothetical protein
MWAIGALAVMLASVACGGAGHEGEDGEDDDVTGPSAPTPSSAPSTTPAPGPTPPSATPQASVAYVQDIKPILDADCVRCHGEFTSYVGVLGVVQPGSASSRLVRATQLGGSMYGYLGGNASAKAELIRRWVVENGAAESR